MAAYVAATTTTVVTYPSTIHMIQTFESDTVELQLQGILKQFHGCHDALSQELRVWAEVALVAEESEHRKLFESLVKMILDQPLVVAEHDFAKALLAWIVPQLPSQEELVASLTPQTAPAGASHLSATDIVCFLTLAQQALTLRVKKAYRAGIEKAKGALVEFTQQQKEFVKNAEKNAEAHYKAHTQAINQQIANQKAEIAQITATFQTQLNIRDQVHAHAIEVEKAKGAALAAQNAALQSQYNSLANSNTQLVNQIQALQDPPKKKKKWWKI